VHAAVGDPYRNMTVCSSAPAIGVRAPGVRLSGIENQTDCEIREKSRTSADMIALAAFHLS
jgi:hypothetical protein